MSSTDSLRSGWEHDLTCGEPDINVRREKRRPRPQQEPPHIVICMSDTQSLSQNFADIFKASDSSDSSDGSWARIHAQWKKTKRSAPRKTAPAPASSTATPLYPSAQPAWLDPDASEADDIEDAQGLLRRPVTRYWQGIMGQVIDRFPHPDPDRRVTMASLLAPGMTRTKQYHMLSLVRTPHLPCLRRVTDILLASSGISCGSQCWRQRTLAPDRRNYFTNPQRHAHVQT